MTSRVPAGEFRVSVPRAYVIAVITLLTLGLLATSTLIAWPAMDVFRGPKEIAFRALAIVLAAVAVFAVTARKSEEQSVVLTASRRELWLVAAIVLWVAFTALVSTNRLVSSDSFVTVLAAAIIFVVARFTSRSMPLAIIDAIVWIPCINAVMVMLQEWRGWNPFHFPERDLGHPASTALLGNPNDVGSYLSAPVLVALIAIVAVRGWRRATFVLPAVILIGGLIASGTRTAIIAVTCGMVAFALMRPWKQRLVAFVVIVAALVGLLRPSTSLGRRARDTVAAARAGRYDLAFSERLPPFLAAIEMTRRRPLAGMGPGCFKTHYMLTRLSLADRYPPSWTRGWPMNFGETHNDHLQTAAEIGLPGYALFLAAIATVALHSVRLRSMTATDAGSMNRLGQELGIPLAVTFFVLCAAQFPLQIAGPRFMFLIAAVISLGSRETE